MACRPSSDEDDRPPVLSLNGADQPDPPAWFVQAVGEESEPLDIHRDGRTIRAYRWGDPAGRPLLLLHGFGANGHWWDHIGPQLITEDLQVVAVDLAGHGASDYATEYTLSGWAADVAEVSRQLSPLKPFLVGHSAGGRIAWKAAELYGTDLLAVVSVDGPLPPPAPQPDGQGSGHSFARIIASTRTGLRFCGASGHALTS